MEAAIVPAFVPLVPGEEASPPVGQQRQRRVPDNARCDDGRRGGEVEEGRLGRGGEGQCRLVCDQSA